jgi:hypothetical protein
MTLKIETRIRIREFVTSKVILKHMLYRCDRVRYNFLLPWSETRVSSVSHVKK